MSERPVSRPGSCRPAARGDPPGPASYIRSESRLIHGPGALRCLPAALGELGHRVLVVASRSTEPFARRALAASLGGRRAGLWVIPHRQLTATAAEALARAVRSAGADSLIAVGGGGTLDTAKAAAVLCSGVASLDELASPPGSPPPEGAPVPAAPPAGPLAPAAPPAFGAGAALPVAAVPTTLSGAEFTSAFTVHEPAAGRSVAYFHPAARPVLVIHDALVLASTPPPLIAASGMNSLAHAIEHYASPYGSRICRFANREAFALSFAALTRLAAVPGDVGALDDALAGSALSEMDHPNTPVGLTHAVAHAVTARRDCAHGLAYAVLLPPCLAYTRLAAEPDFAVLARLATGAAGADLVAAASRLRDSLGLPARLRELGVAAEELPAISAAAMSHFGSSANARVPASAEEILCVLRQAW
jgi:alcohol dehydrogenase class IV